MPRAISATEVRMVSDQASQLAASQSACSRLRANSATSQQKTPRTARAPIIRAAAPSTLTTTRSRARTFATLTRSGILESLGPISTFIGEILPDPLLYNGGDNRTASVEEVPGAKPPGVRRHR